MDKNESNIIYLLKLSYCDLFLDFKNVDNSNLKKNHYMYVHTIHPYLPYFLASLYKFVFIIGARRSSIISSKKKHFGGALVGLNS